MPTINGNSGNNYLNGSAGNDTIYGFNGDDTLVGNGGNDTLVGGNGDDRYWVKDAGDLVVEAGTGYDAVWSEISYTLTANVEELDLLGTANINGTGNGLDNWIFDNSGNNVLSGMAGNDTLVSTLGGIDTLVGGTGDDTYWINSASTVITETNTTDWDAVWSEVTYTLPTNVEELDLIGSSNINATGNSGVNFLYGNSGDNKLDGLAGNDNLIGNAGNDTLQGGGGADSMQGGAGDDYYYVDNAGDVVSEESTVGIDDGGYDKVAASISYTLTAHVEELDLLGSANINGTGNSDANWIFGNAGNNVLTGLDGADTLVSNGGVDTLVGGNGEDTYWVTNTTTVVTETNAVDWDAVWSEVSYTLGANLEELDLLGTANLNGTGNSGVNFIYGNSGNNVLNGLAGNDTLIGNAGNDTLQGGGDADSMLGGQGDDYYYVDNAGDVVSEESTVGIDDGGYDKVASSIDYTLTAHVEELDLLGSANLNGTGNADANWIFGNTGNNVLTGLGGADTLVSNGGIDTLVGGKGEDTYWVTNTSTVVLETNTVDWDAVWSEVTYTLGTNLEELDLLGTANLNGTGNKAANFIYGNSGNNVLTGLGGADTLIGNGGVDTLYGGDGNDTYYVDSSNDVVSEESTGLGINDGGHDLVYSSASFTLGSFVEDLTLTGTADLNGIGNTKYNAITGNDGNNTLWGLGGNDTLNGGNGQDTLYGGAGDDTYYVNSAGDVASEESSGVGINDGGHDQVISSVSFTLGTFIEDLTLTGTADINGTGNENYSNIMIGNAGANYLSGLSGGDTMSGNDGNDTLDGGVGRDSLDGGNGNDLLLGGSGKDTLSGGAGNDTLSGGIDTDTFVFAAAGAANGLDTVQDFVHGVDELLFATADYGFAAGHSLTASEFTAGSAAVGASAQFVWDAASHTLYWDHDGAGGDAAVAIATFDAAAILTAGDFHFG